MLVIAVTIFVLVFGFKLLMDSDWMQVLFGIVLIVGFFYAMGVAAMGG